MNRQEVFDTVAAHLLKQGAKSMGIFNGEMDCKYRGRGGLKCAIGVLIKDECYSRDIEGKAPYATEVMDALRNSGIDVQAFDRRFLEDDRRFLKELQHIHDLRPPKEWARALERFAVDEGLNADVVNNNIAEK